MLSVGRLVWKKGHEYAVEALAKLVDQGIEAELQIIGTGVQDRAIRFAAFDLGVLDRVTLLGSKRATKSAPKCGAGGCLRHAQPERRDSVSPRWKRRR